MSEETICGKKIHRVGKGICGRIVVQVKIKHDSWKLGQIIDYRVIEMFGRKRRFLIK